MQPPPRWAIGVAVNILGSIAINLGTNLMKLSHKHEKGEMSPPTMAPPPMADIE
ncbi:unnamed protein product, partial [Phaeothamnion confervicola]